MEETGPGIGLRNIQVVNFKTEILKWFGQWSVLNSGKFYLSFIYTKSFCRRPVLFS